MKELLEELNVAELMNVKGGLQAEDIKIKCNKTNSGVICNSGPAVSS